jgi:hypothetical protein
MTAPTNKLYLDSSPDNTYGFRKCCESIRQAVPVQDVARRYTDLEPLGGRAWFTGRCPLPSHEDKEPSFYIYPPGRYHCYGCGGHGDCIDLEFHCGDYDELWQAMVSLSLEFGVELPKRPQSWYQRQERQKSIRDGIEQVRIRSLHRRLFRWVFLPMVERIEDPDERREEAERIWTDTADLARLMYVRLREGASL